MRFWYLLLRPAGRAQISLSLCQNPGPSINGLVTDGNTKLCCHGFILALFKVLQPIKLILIIPETI